jgi:transcriptional regulator with XRE-family HTH domain
MKGVIELPGTERRHNAVVVRRHMARQLERLRRESDHSQSSLAKALGWSQRKQAMLEAGDQAPSEKDLDRILPTLRVPETQWDEWYSWAAAARGRSWWDSYSDADLPPASKRYIGFEQAATKIRTFQPLAVHGLLQTTSYREAIVRDGSTAPRPGEQVMALLEVSWRRQQVLHGSDPVELRLVLYEAALHLKVGATPEVMREQLDHLASMVEQNHTIAVQVLPFDAGPHPGLGGSFSILEFGWADDPGFVYLESRPDRPTYLEERSDIYTYSQIFDRLSAIALPPDRSLEMLRDMAKRSRKAKP